MILRKPRIFLNAIRSIRGGYTFKSPDFVPVAPRVAFSGMGQARIENNLFIISYVCIYKYHMCFRYTDKRTCTCIHIHSHIPKYTEIRIYSQIYTHLYTYVYFTCVTDMPTYTPHNSSNKRYESLTYLAPFSRLTSERHA